MADLIDSGPAGRDVTITQYPKTNLTGYVEEAKGIRFYNIDASGILGKCGGSVYSGPTSTPFDLLTDGGIAIEIVFSMPVTPDITVSNKGFILYSINGDGQSATGPSTYHSGLGGFTVGVCDSGGRPAATPSGTNAYKLYIGASTVNVAATGDASTGNSFSTFFGSAINDGLFHVVHINLEYNSASLLSDILTINSEIFLDGNSLGTYVFNAPRVFPSSHANAGRIPIRYINIGGFDYISGQTPSDPINSTASFPGIIDQVRIYDAPLTEVEIDAVVTGYSLPST